MRKTPFAGLTELEPSESLATDGGSFVSRNPSIIDYYLEIGARSHRHTGDAPLADPAAPPIVTVSTAGGTIPADTVLAVTYTLVDERGGETRPAPVVTLTTPLPMDEPFEAPQIALELDQGGTLTVGTYYYAASLIDDAGGETPIGPIAEVVREPGAATARVRLTGLADLVADAGALRYRLYRAKDQGEFDLLAEGVADEVLDDGSLVLDCSVSPQTVNSTHSTNSVSVIVPALPADAAGFRVFIGVDGVFTSPSLYGPTRLPAEAGLPIVVDGVLVDEGAPPDVATAVAGAHKIDAETEIENLRWQPPVADEAALPTIGNIAGDARVALAEMTLWGWGGTAWVALGGGGAYTATPVGGATDAGAPTTGPGWGEDAATEARWALERTQQSEELLREFFNPADPNTINDRFHGGSVFEQVPGEDRIRPLDSNGLPINLMARDSIGGAGTLRAPAGAGAAIYTTVLFATNDWQMVGLASGRLRLELDRLLGTLRIWDNTGDVPELVLGAADGVIVPEPTETLYLELHRFHDHVRAYFEVEDAGGASLGVLEPTLALPEAQRPVWWQAGNWTIEFLGTWADNTTGAFEVDDLSADVIRTVRTLALYELDDGSHTLSRQPLREIGPNGRGFHQFGGIELDPAWTFPPDEPPLIHEANGWVWLSGAVTPPDANATTPFVGLLAGDPPIPEHLRPSQGSFTPRGTRVFTALDVAGVLQRVSVDLATGVVSRDTTGAATIPLYGIGWPL